MAPGGLCIRRIGELGEQHCPEMGDVPAASGIAADDPVLVQTLYDTVSNIRQRLVGEVELAGIVDARKHLIFGQETRGDAGLPEEWLERSPQCPLPVGEVGQAGRR